MFGKRLGAYLIDMLILSVVLNIFGSFFINNNNYQKLNKELDTLNESYVNKEITTETFINNEVVIVQDLDKELFLSNVLEAFLIVGYFIILPYLNSGRTLGKMLFKIKITSDKELDYNKLIIRALLIDGLGYLLIQLGTVYLLPSMAYFIVVNVLSLLELLLLVIGSIMIIKNKEQGLHDKLSNTKVVIEK